MVKTDEQSRPYAAPANIIAVIDRARTRNLPETINNDFLRIAGVPEAVWYRVMQAVRFLGLIHEDGRPSDTFEALAGATESQYKELLEKVIREAYKAEFNVIDPAQDPQARIVDAFRPYKPRSQTLRMVMLFQGLCREAGIPVLDAPRERRMRDLQVKRPKSTVEKRSIGVPTVRQTSERIIVPSATGVLFGVTEEDVAALEEEEFNEVWAALGKVARARARAKKKAQETDAERTKQEGGTEEKE
jgi:hypothetical protein